MKASNQRDAFSAPELSFGENRLSRIFNALPSLIAYVGNDLRYKYINESYSRWFNLPPSEIIGKHISEVLGQSAFEKLTPHLDAVLSGKTTGFETELNYTSGARYINASYMPDIDAVTGKVLGFTGFVTDITDRRQAELALALSENKYKKLVGNLPVGMYSCDKDGRIIFYNEVAVKLWGYAPPLNDDNVKFCACHKAWLPDGTLIAPAETPMATALKEGMAFRNLEAVIGRPDGSRFFALINIDPLFDEQGKVIGATNIFQDITEKKEAEMQLRESEHRLRELLEALPAAIYTCNAEGVITSYNKAAVELWGREPELGKDMWCGSWKIFSARDGSHVPLDTCPMAIALKTGKAVVGEEILVEKPDGSRYYVQPHPKPLYDSSGKLVGAINLLMDITPRKQIEKVLDQARKRIEKNAEDLQLILETIPQMAWTSLPDGHVDYLNKAWYEFTGATDLTGWNWENHIYPDDHLRTYDKWMHSLKTGEHYEIEYRWVRHDGAVRWMLGRAKPIKSGSGDIIMWIGTATDIHDQKTIDEKKDEFIGIASHELKTPLTSLKAYIQLLETVLPGDNESLPYLYVRKANEYVRRLNNLISDLLDVTKIQSGKLTLEVSEFSFDEFADECIEALRQTNISHQLLIEGETKAVVMGDKSRLEQVFTNYILNAIKYSPKADKVIINLSASGNMLQVAVTDFGVGIPQEELNKLFERFYRAQSHAQKFSGLGLGLYISAEIVSRHGGRTWAESQLGKGSTFYFSLPIV
jgi:PAS domain S-box-containing protein